MTEQKKAVAGLVDLVVAQWTIVAIAAGATLAVSVIYALMTVPSTTWIATAQLRVTNNTNTLPNAPTPDGVVEAALRPTTLAKAGASLEQSGVIDAEVRIDPKSRYLIDLTVTDGKSADRAREKATRLSEAVKETVTDPLKSYTDHQQGMASDADVRINELQAQLTEIRKIITDGGLTARDRAAHESAVVGVRAQLYDALDRARISRYNAQLASRHVMPVGEVVVTSVSSAASLLAAAVRGLAIGLLVGVAVAAVRERLGSGSAPAA